MITTKITSLVVWLLLYLWFYPMNWNFTTLGLHLTGKFDPSKDFFLFLAKFGFQKTDIVNKMDSHGYIYGNITQVQPYKNSSDVSITIIELIFSVKLKTLEKQFIQINIAI